MYWVNGDDEIHFANLDGTRRRLFLRVRYGRFDGMVIDVRRSRLNTILFTTDVSCLGSRYPIQHLKGKPTGNRT